ncbi:hypothetical protein EWH99_05660 [Sporolactobacillus sp. THM7-7]|nr:hypothetical protein EWH99_05660 [Sporolactobacillus sp. THM7-7]
MLANELTPKEKRIIRQYMLLPLIRMALERDKRMLRLTNMKFKARYIELINEAIRRVTEDMRQNKDELFDHHIRMTRRNWLEYEVYTRGRVFEVGYQKSIAGEWIYEQVKVYLPIA